MTEVSADILSRGKTIHSQLAGLPIAQGLDLLCAMVLSILSQLSPEARAATIVAFTTGLLHGAAEIAAAESDDDCAGHA